MNSQSFITGGKMTDARRFHVSGRVQGVYYRANTQQKAVALGLTGWVRNLPDGRVEVLACGEAPVLDQLEKWLWQGPERAQVNSVEVSPAAEEDAVGCSNFQVLR